MDALSEAVSTIPCIYGAPRLYDHITFVIVLIHIVDSYARFFVPGIYYGIVYMVAIHTLATVRGEQSRVNVDDLARIFVYKRIWYLPQKAGQNDERWLVVLYLLYHQGLVKSGLINDKERYFLSFGNIQHTGCGFVAHYK